MMLWLLDMLYLDGHKNLIDKFMDPMRDELREIRYWVRENYNFAVSTAIQLHNYHLAREMKMYHAVADYEMLYDIMVKFLTEIGEIV